MKKIQVLLVAFVFAGAMTAAFAVTGNTTAKATLDVEWFQYDPQHPGGTSNPDNYVLMTSEPSCFGSGSLCAIQAPVVNGSEPDLDNIVDQRFKQ